MATQDRHDTRFDNRVGGGRVADKEQGTVYSPNQIDTMKKLSDTARSNQTQQPDEDVDEPK